jgi:hypothetical protein
MDRNYRMLVDQRSFGFKFGFQSLLPLWYRILRDGAINGGRMRQPKAAIRAETHDQSSICEVICEQGIVELHVQHPQSNLVPERPFSQDWKDVQDRVRDYLTTHFMANTHCSS